NHVEKLCGLTRRSMCCRIFSQEFMPLEPSKRGKKSFHSYFHSCGKAVGIHGQKTLQRLHSVSGCPRSLPLGFPPLCSRHGVHGDASCRTELVKVRVDSRRTHVVRQVKISRGSNTSHRRCTVFPQRSISM